MFRVNLSSSKPIYEQIMEQVKVSIFKGYLSPGDSLPSVRKLALTLSVTPNTVAKAYQLLEKEKVIVTVRGKGAFISEKVEIGMDEMKLASIRQELKSIVLELRYSGFDEKKTLDLVREIYADLEGKKDEDDRD